ncbi:MAG: TonB-dependent receptor [Bacteroidota bacterium]|nr:TonB-dependent receptor [Bacteroidota bacterium]
MVKYIVLFPFFLTFLTAQEKPFGSITGQLIDGTTNQPLVGANIVVIEQSTIGATTDNDGNFTIQKIVVGEYSIRATLLGYKNTILTNIVVSTGRSSKVKMRMNEEAIEVGEVEVKADYFSSEGSISSISTIGLNAAEVKRSPGSALDMQRIVQNLPSVANSNDQSNELIVRGGSPDENLTIMDHIEIPTTNHFPNQFNSGGPINMVNVDLIEDIRFSTGGFPANFGDKLSSVMDISLREGDKQRAMAGEFGAHFAGTGAVFEGGFADQKGNWIFSARQSFLETLDKIVGISSLGITAIPKYYDMQGKITYEFSTTQKLIISGIYGSDIILINGEPDEKNDQKKFVKDSTGVENVDVKTSQFAVGATLRSLYGADGYSLFTVYMLGNRYDVNVSEDFTYREYDGNGAVTKFQKLLSNSTFVNDATERMIGAKYDLLFHLFNDHELSVGGQAVTTEKFVNNVFFNSDTLRFDLNHDGDFIDPFPTDIDTSTFTNGRISNRLGFGEEYKFAGYVSDKFLLTDQLSATVGLRYDYFTYSEKGNWSPRVSLSYELFPLTTKVNFAYGEYYQTLALPRYGDNLGGTTNRYLDNTHARHFVIGIEHILDEGLKATLEAYYKSYDHITVDERFIKSADKTFRSDKRLSVGERTSQGVEMFIQQKQVEGFYGTFSLSYSRSITTDPREDIFDLPPINVGEYPSDYDFPFLLTLVAGKTVGNVRSTLNESPFYIKYPSYILPLSDDMEFSFRFRYSSGRPYTPRVFTSYIQRREGTITWSKGVWEDGAEINSARYPDYHRLDLQWINRWHNEGYNIVMIVALQNVYNRANVAGYQYVTDGTRNTIYQFSFFPVIGASVEF